MGTATRKAAKAMALRVNLCALAMAGGLEAQGAKRAKKTLASSWGKRFSASPGGFHAPDGRAVMHVKATRPYRAK